MNDTRRPAYVDRRPTAAQDNGEKFLGLAAVTGLVVVAMAIVFWIMAATDVADIAQGPESAPPPAAVTAAPAPAPSPTPTAVVTPPAPAANELSSNDWLLSPYAVVRDGGNLTVTGTVQNRGSQTRAATMRVFVYVNGGPVATAVGEVRDVPAGGSVDVSFPSGTPWSAGNKVLLVQAEDLAAPLP